MDSEQVKKATTASKSHFARRRHRDVTKCPGVPVVAVWVMDELPVDVLGFLRVELLPAIGALDLPVSLDADVDGGAVARLGGVADLHGLGHPSVAEAALRRRQNARS